MYHALHALSIYLSKTPEASGDIIFTVSQPTGFRLATCDPTHWNRKYITAHVTFALRI
jgi:hypothetical protein